MGKQTAKTEDDLKKEKLALEVEGLRIQNERDRRKWLVQLEKFIPLVTTAVAIGGLLLGIWQFRTSTQAEHDKEMRQANSERDRELRQTKQAKIEALLKQPKTRVPPASLIRETLNYLRTRTDAAEAREISQELRLLFVYDYIETNDKLTASRVMFDNLVNDYWDDYRVLMSERTSDNIRLINRYLQLIDASSDRTTRNELRDALFRHGLRLIESHCDPDDEKERDELLEKINKQLNHFTLTKSGPVRK